MKITFIGLGKMGWHMAGHLSKQGHAITVYDRDRQTAQKWVGAFTGQIAPDPRQACVDTELVVTALPADEQLQAVWQACYEGLKPSTIWVDHSTTSAHIARELSVQAQSRALSFIDAPVSGGTLGAQNGSLTVMAGGDQAAWAVVEPVVQAYANKTTWLGDAGSGQLTKMANQICVAGIGQALAEGLAFAERAGLDTKKVLGVMLKGSSTSWMMEHRSEAMLQGEYAFGFSTKLMQKDLRLVLQEARVNGMPLPVTSLVAELLDELAEMQDPDWDWCSLMERQRKAC